MFSGWWEWSESPRLLARGMGRWFSYRQLVLYGLQCVRLRDERKRWMCFHVWWTIWIRCHGCKTVNAPLGEGGFGLIQVALQAGFLIVSDIFTFLISLWEEKEVHDVTNVLPIEHFAMLLNRVTSLIKWHANFPAVPVQSSVGGWQESTMAIRSYWVAQFVLFLVAQWLYSGTSSVPVRCHLVLQDVFLWWKRSMSIFRPSKRGTSRHFIISRSSQVTGAV